MMAYFHSLHPEGLQERVEGSGIAEDKRMINAKSPWTLAHLEMKILKDFYKNPAVPPSMRKKLKDAMMIKPTLRGGEGGLKGVSKASGYIRRLMWENKHKHKGDYKKPTWELAKDSKMKRADKFEWKKLASKDQGGLNKKEYGSSPFITTHFKGLNVKFNPGKGEYPSETEAQTKARRGWKKHFGDVTTEAKEEPKQEVKEAPKNEILEHFGNLEYKPDVPVGLEISEEKPEVKPEVKETPNTEQRVWEASEIKQLPEDKREFDWQDRYKEADKRSKDLINFALNNPKAKLAQAIAHLKESGYTTGLSPSTISPIFKDAKEDAEIGIRDTLKYEEFHQRSTKLKAVLEKGVKNRRAIKSAKSILAEKRYEKQVKEEEEGRKAEQKRKVEEREAKVKESHEKILKANEERKAREEERRKMEQDFEDSLTIKDNELLIPIIQKATTDNELVVVIPQGRQVRRSAEDRKNAMAPTRKTLGDHRDRYKDGKTKLKQGDFEYTYETKIYPKMYNLFPFADYRKELASLKASALKLQKEGALSPQGWKGKMKHHEAYVGNDYTAWERAGKDLAEWSNDLGLNLDDPVSTNRSKVSKATWVGEKDAKFQKYYNDSFAKIYNEEDAPMMKKFLKGVDEAISKSSDAELQEKNDKLLTEAKAELARLKKEPAVTPKRRIILSKKPKTSGTGRGGSPIPQMMEMCGS